MGFSSLSLSCPILFSLTIRASRARPNACSLSEVFRCGLFLWQQEPLFPCGWLLGVFMPLIMNGGSDNHRQIATDAGWMIQISHSHLFCSYLGNNGMNRNREAWQNTNRASCAKHVHLKHYVTSWQEKLDFPRSQMCISEYDPVTALISGLQLHLVLKVYPDLIIKSKPYTFRILLQYVGNNV